MLVKAKKGSGIIKTASVLTVIVALCLIAPLFAQSQSLRFTHYSVEHGLSHNQVNCILQDRGGFMWFGTSGGLNRFDGYEFRTYTHDPADPHSLSNNTVWGLLEDRTGAIWVATRDGLNRFDPATETFEVFRQDERLNENWNELDAIFEDTTGSIWLGSWGGLSRFDPAAGTFTPFSLPPIDSGHPQRDAIKVIFEDRFGVLWIGTRRRGLLQFDRNSRSFRQLDEANLQGDAGVEIWGIYEDRAGNLWVCSNDVGLSRLDREQDTFTHFSYEGTRHPSVEMGMLDMLEDRSGRFWLASISLLQFDPATRTFVEPALHDPDRSGAIDVIALYEDKEESLWMGSLGGIYKLDRTPRIFHNIPTPNPVTAIWEDTNSHLWVGTAKGLSRYDGHGHPVAHYQHVPGDTGSLGNGNVYTIFQDHLGALWVSTAGSGVSRFDDRTGTFEHFRSEENDPHTLSNNWVRYLLEDHSGILWAGTDEGLSRFHRQSNAFRSYQHRSGEYDDLIRSYIYAMCEDRYGDLWIGTTGGLYRLERTNESFHSYRHDAADPVSLSHNAVTAILEDRSGTTWIGTNGGGLNKFERATDSFIRFKEEDGLANNAICGILEDDQGRLWISTSNGLSRFNTQTATFKNYDKSDGLVGNVFSKLASHRGHASGRMFFGGADGLTIFHPDSIRDNPYVPPVVITHFERHNPGVAVDSVIVHKGIAQKKAIRLSHDDMIFTVKFAALSYYNPAKNRYAYKLEGVNDLWIALGRKREVTFTGLAPGNYTLRVKGSNNDGIWNEQGTALAIVVAPPWWKTWWAYSVYLLAFAVLLYGLRRYELNRQRYKYGLQLEKVESERIKELDHLKSRFFANISHEFRTPLTLILGQIDSVRALIKEKGLKNRLNMAETNAQRLLRLINQLLDLSKLEAGGMQLRAVKSAFVPFLRKLVSTFESLAKQKHIDLEFSTYVPEELEAYFDPEKLEKVFLNLLGNAFKFTPEGGTVTVTVAVGRGSEQYSVTSKQLSVSSKQSAVGSNQSRVKPLITDHCLLITVKDTGIGIPPEQLAHIFDRFHQVEDTHTRMGTGIGLALAKELVELHRGKISVFSQRGVGSEFVVKLPLGKDHLDAKEIVTEQPGRKMDSQHVMPLDEAEESMDSDLEEAASPAADAKEVILIVEDHRDVRAYVREQLEAHYRVIEAENGQQGLNCAQQIIPDLIITDVMMPEMDGHELAGQIRKDEKTSHIPIIMLTAKAAEEDKLEGLETGVDDYLTKPFSPKELLARVRNLIEQRRRLRKRFSRATVIKPSEVTATSIDQTFLNRVLVSIEKHLGDENFTVQSLAAYVHMSVSQLNRKLNALIDQSAGQVVRSMRLQRAADLLQQNAGTIAEIAYQVGFSDQAHFTRSFKKQFGVAPSAFRGKG